MEKKNKEANPKPTFHKRELPKPFTEKEKAILLELYDNQMIQDFKNFCKAVYTFSFYQNGVPVGAPNYDELLEEVHRAYKTFRKQISKVEKGEIIALGDCVSDY